MSERSSTPRSPSIRVGAIVAVFVVVAVGVIIWVSEPPEAKNGAPQDAAGEPRRPNVVFIVADTLRADHLSYQGHERPTSPNLDRLAKRSLVMTWHHSNASRTGPSTATIFTGQHPRTHGVLNPLDVWDAKAVLGEQRTTLAELLRDAGYQTSAIVGNANIAKRFGFSQGFEQYEHAFQKNAQAITDGAIEKLEGLSKDEPFFFYLHYMDPHSPYWAPPPYSQMWEDGSYQGQLTGSHGELDRILIGSLTQEGDIERTLSRHRRYTGQTTTIEQLGLFPQARDIEHLRVLYDQEIRFLDAQIGRLLEAVEDMELRDNTIVVFTSDHGEEFMEHGAVLHGYTLFEEQLHVPLLIDAPQLDGEKKVHKLTQHLDVLPTLLELVDVKAPEGLPGKSLLPLAKEEAAESYESYPLYAQTRLRAVRVVDVQAFLTDGHKVIRSLLPKPGWALFKVPGPGPETQDLAESQPELLRKMREEMRAYEQQMPVFEKERVQLTPDETEALRALGYVE